MEVIHEQLKAEAANQPDRTFNAHFTEVPVDIYRQFGLDIGTAQGKEFDKLKDISKWAFDNENTVGDNLMRLKQLQVKLGAPRIGEQSYDKVYNWVKIQGQITDLMKRQEAL